MFTNEKGRHAVIEAKIFTSEDDLLLSEVLKLKKNPDQKQFQKISKTVSDEWTFLTHGSSNQLVLQVEESEQTGWSYGFDIKHFKLTKQPIFTQTSCVTHAIPGNYASDETKNRVAFLMHHVKSSSNDKVQDTAGTAALYAETNYYLANAIQDQDANPSEHAADCISKTTHILMNLEDMLESAHPGIIHDLDKSLAKSLAGVRIQNETLLRVA